MSFTGRMKQRLWAFGNRLTERDAKYAIKTGMATAILAAPAFFDSTRPIFIRYYGDWALISVSYLLSGLAFLRSWSHSCSILLSCPQRLDRRTLWVYIVFWEHCQSIIVICLPFTDTEPSLSFSAAVAAGVYSLFPENAIALAIFGFFYSIPCFYLLVGQPKYAPSARFLLLTYNLTCLYW